MLFKELIRLVTWKEIAKRLPELYPTYCLPLDGYEYTFKTLLTKRARKCNPPITIELQYIKPEKENGEEGYWDVIGRGPGDTLYALDLMTFSKWLGFTVDSENLSQEEKVDLVCHCLWEMTFYGFSDREINNKARMLSNRIKKLS